MHPWFLAIFFTIFVCSSWISFLIAHFLITHPVKSGLFWKYTYYHTSLKVNFWSKINFNKTLYVGNVQNILRENSNDISQFYFWYFLRYFHMSHFLMSHVISCCPIASSWKTWRKLHQNVRDGNWHEFQASQSTRRQRRNSWNFVSEPSGSIIMPQEKVSFWKVIFWICIVFENHSKSLILLHRK